MADPESLVEHESASDRELARFSEELRGRQRMLERFLKVRALLGLILMGASLCGAAIAAAFLLAGLGLWTDPRLTRWTGGFDAVLAVLMPGLFTWLTARTGVLWWRDRHVDAQAEAGQVGGCE